MLASVSRKIIDTSIIPFSIDKFGLYSITITAFCKSAEQDLRVEIDDLKNIPSTWNGAQAKQYSAFNKTDRNRAYVENPFWKDSEINKIAWYNAYNISGKVISGEIKDPTNGANHYYDSSISTPYWATKKTLVLTVNSSNNKFSLIFHKL